MAAALRSQARIVERHSGRRHERAGSGGHQKPALLSQSPDRDITHEGDRCDQHDQQPELVRVDRVPGIDGPIGKHGQQKECHRQQDDDRTQLRPGQFAQQLMEIGAGREQCHCRDTRPRRRRAIANHRKGAKRKSYQARHRGRDRHVIPLGRLAPFEGCKHYCEGEARRGERHSPKRGKHRAPKPSEQTDEGKSTNAGDARAVGLLAPAPAPFETDQETDRKRKPKSLEKIECVHLKRPRPL